MCCSQKIGRMSGMSVGNKPKILQDSEQIQEFDCVDTTRENASHDQKRHN
jgi:hypothetical protein